MYIKDVGAVKVIKGRALDKNVLQGNIGREPFQEQLVQGSLLVDVVLKVVPKVKVPLNLFHRWFVCVR